MTVQRTTGTARSGRQAEPVGGDEPNWVDVWGVEPEDTDVAEVAPRRVLPVVATLLGLFAIMAVAAVWHHGPLAGDTSLGADLLRHRGELGWQIADAVSFCASGPMVALAAAAAAVWLLISRRQVVEALAVLAAPAAAGVIEVAAKIVVARPRPVTSVLTGESGNGFPSGHVTGFTALVVVLLVVFVLADDTRSRGLQRLWTATTVLSVLLVMWSRVALGAHYVSDTVGGALLGAAVGLAVVPVVAAVVAPIGRRLQRTR